MINWFPFNIIEVLFFFVISFKDIFYNFPNHFILDLTWSNNLQQLRPARLVCNLCSDTWHLMFFQTKFAPWHSPRWLFFCTENDRFLRLLLHLGIQIISSEHGITFVCAFHWVALYNYWGTLAFLFYIVWQEILSRMDIHRLTHS